LRFGSGMTPIEPHIKKISRFSSRRWGRRVARVGVREVEVRVSGGLEDLRTCGRWWHDTDRNHT
jgi:hypothetical protein